MKSDNPLNVMPIYVINLSRSSERWNHMNRELLKHSVDYFERVEAVDGGALLPSETEVYYDSIENSKHYFVPLKTAEIACFLSHRRAWEMLLESEFSSACVLEDDIRFTDNPRPVLQAISAFLQSPEPLMVKIYSPRPVNSLSLPLFNLTYRLHAPRHVPLGMPGLCLNRAAAQRLLAFSERFFEPVDVALQRTWHHGVKIWILQPSIVQEVSETLGGTTLHSQNRRTFASRFRRELRRPWFRLRRRWESQFKTRPFLK